MNERTGSSRGLRRIWWAAAFAGVAYLAAAGCAIAAPEFLVTGLLGRQDFDQQRPNPDHSNNRQLGIAILPAPHWGVEAMFGRLDARGGGKDASTAELSGLYIPIPDAPWMGYLAGGIGRYAPTTAKENQLHLGFGVLAPIGESWGLRADARVFRTSDSLVETRWMIGLYARFGGAGRAPAIDRDSDADGLKERLDHCPGTPAGVAVDARGCPLPVAEQKVVVPLDSDGDGVFDDADLCPHTPAGTKVDANGCPIKERAAVPLPPPPPAPPVDSDQDGVPDGADKCADTPAGLRVDEAGCPLLDSETVSITLKVNFDTGKHVVKPEYRGQIEKVAEFLRTYASVFAEIQGHSDNQGNAANNRGLSERRALAIRQVLIDQFGIGGDRLTARGYGPDQPIADNKTEAGRAENRRVVVQISATKKAYRKK